MCASPDGGSAGGPAGEQGVQRSSVSGSEPPAATGAGHRQIQPQRAAEEAGCGEVDRLRAGRAVQGPGEFVRLQHESSSCSASLVAPSF